MSPIEIYQFLDLLSGLPLHGLLLAAVIILWFELKKTRAELDSCLKGNALSVQRINVLQAWVDNVDSMSE